MRPTNEESVQSELFEQTDVSVQIVEAIIGQRITVVMAVETVYDTLDEELCGVYSQNTEQTTRSGQE